MLNDAIPLIDIISETKDGEWGKGEPFANSCEMTVIRGTDFEKARIGTIDNIPRRFIPLNIANQKRLRPHDILIETAGGTETNPTGKVVYLSPRLFDNNPSKQFTCASFSRFIRVDSLAANPNYIYWYLRFLYDNRISYMFHVQHTGVARFQWTKFAKSKLIILPPLPIQRRIADILSAYDELIEVNQQRIRLLEATARQLYREWFVRLRFPGWKETKGVKGVPEGIGRISYFKDFIKLNRGFDLPETKMTSGEYPVVAATSIKGYHNEYKLNAPCIVTGRSGSLGKVQFVNQKCWPLNTTLYVKDFKGNSPFYVYYFLSNIDFEAFNSGAGVPTLNQNHLHNLRFWVPDKSLQNKFEDLIKPIFQQIETLQQQNIHLRQIRDRLLPRLVSGKLAVKDVEPATGP